MEKLIGHLGRPALLRAKKWPRGQLEKPSENYGMIMDKCPIARLEYQGNQLLVGISLGNLCVCISQRYAYIEIHTIAHMSNGYRGFGMIEDLRLPEVR